MALCNYQVFLSFRGPDTRDNFVQYLQDRLQGLRIVSFLDSEEINYGHSIRAVIMDAIERSDICVPVFSPDFATSTACLKEVAQMVKSKKEILPIFFSVKPSDVKYQKGTYETSFDEHKRKGRYTESTIQEWRKALEKIADKRGLEFKNAALGEIGGIAKPAIEKAAPEAPNGRFWNDLFTGIRELEVFISKIWELSRRMVDQDVTRNLVGIERDVPTMMRKLGFYHHNGVVKERAMTGRRVLVVWGVAGVGKTTLAKVVFRKISHLFQGHSLLENVQHEFRMNRGLSLQNKLIRELKGGGGEIPDAKTSDEGTITLQYRLGNRKVLILMDDVDDEEQVKPFAEKLTWFGRGSVIILTTTKKSVFNFYERQNEGNVINHHDVSPMNEDSEDCSRALELFYKHAFPLDHPREVYENWSKEIIRAVQYLPFAIEKVGSYLNGKSHADWMETLNGLESSPAEGVRRIWKKHYDSLCHHAPNAENIFLDIACFFAGVEKALPCEMWAALGWTPRRSVVDLENMSFLRIGQKNEFLMYNQLKLFGREIVNKENPWERSRLWDYEDVKKTLNREKVADKVKALRVASNFNEVNGAKFHHVPHLRFLELDKVDIDGDHKGLLPDLVWLHWHGRTEESSRGPEKLPEESSGHPKTSQLFAFNMEKLVILKLCSIPDTLTLDDWGRLMKKAQSLKVLDLKGCSWVKASMDIPASRLLKRLILEGCLYLSLTTTNSKFQNLVSLSVKHCPSVEGLTEALCSMKALKELFIDGTGIEILHFEQGSPPELETLSACGCKALCEVTESIGLLKNLQKLFLGSCEQLNTLPPVLEGLGQLHEMDLSYTSIDELPPWVQHCKKLQVLKMARTFVEAFPEAIKQLKELKELDFTDCGSLSGHCDIAGLSSLRILKLKRTRISEVAARDEAQFCLHILELDDGVRKQIPIGPGEHWYLQA